MTERAVMPYGSWPSPVSAAMVAADVGGFDSLEIDGDTLYWCEMRPDEGGRYVLVARDAAGGERDLTPPPYNVRSRVHEYGGGAWTHAGEIVCFVNFEDQQIYTATDAKVTALTDMPPCRFADLTYDARRNRLIAVCEDHSPPGDAVNSLVSIDLDSGDATPLATGRDFYSGIALAQDGNRLAWLAWDHPDMPWDAAELWIGELAAGGCLRDGRRLAGGNGESCAQPRWAPDGTLYAVSDRTDWWNLYRWDEDCDALQPVCPCSAEFTPPLWQFGAASYDVNAEGDVICASTQDGVWSLGRISRDGSYRQIPCAYTEIADLHCDSGRCAFIAGAAQRPCAIVSLDRCTLRTTVVREASVPHVPPNCLSLPEPVTFPTEGGLDAHGIFYPPHSLTTCAREEEMPPLVVKIHGGPTGSASTKRRLSTQYYTSRGIAVLDVNYGGSTGYGRRYRARLDGKWGVVDVNDAANGARFLAAAKRVDPARIAITGGSAGGYTALAALAFRSEFAVGASHFGVSDCELLAQETHKFESRYLDKLIGPYPEDIELYRQRSPIHHADRISCPVVFFQGLEDMIVPPNQARLMADALRGRGIPVALVEFPGEQHGFRRAENIIRAIEGELSFFAAILGFPIADVIAPLAIDNMRT